ncbi:aromatic amino acid lyase [Nocardioides sp. CFH 31398]|uniref:aromatic amino acid lyase n=1 Tax=Nocardioides sp. CFH 31398 TaxID=2919579 RepID=UPI001F056632|nr:aromatic amino acid lyase [Nocardioides sp. CFH 31398]MCH1864990.1 aromatic amino acid lyase [Nocardioides sp. CFH 31398]
MTETLAVARPEDLDAAAVLEVARGADVELAPDLLTFVRGRRDEVVSALAGGVAAYGVSTGMGALSDVALSVDEQTDHSARLMLARAVGGPPWLDEAETRALLAVRLRTFLSGDAGVSAELCTWLTTLLADGALPAVPRTGSGAAGEIIPLAHAFGHLAGVGRWLGRAALADPPRLGPKEGLSLLQGVPTATALALLRADDVRRVAALETRLAAAQVALVGASRDPYALALARGDRALAGVLADLAAALPPVTDATPVRRLQAPVSFRVVGPVLAHLARQGSALEAAADRALTGVTDSPAWLPESGAFVGTAGFHGLDLAAALDGLRVALAHTAAVGTARLHRMLDPVTSGLPAQLSAAPGPHGGLVAVHKRAAAAVHAVSGWAPTPLGTAETSGGQEDVQTFALEAAERLRLTVDAAREVQACGLLAVHQARLLAPHLLADAPPPLASLLDDLAAVLPATTLDRPWGEDLQRLLDGPLLGRS